MKTNWCVPVAILSTFLVISCNKETDPIPQPGEKNARLELLLKGTPVSTGRSTDATLPADEGNIKTIAVGVFSHASGDVNIITEPTVAQSGSTLSSINCTPGIVDIVVVVNAPTGSFAGVLTKNDFIAKTVSLSTTQVSNVQTSDNLPMSGEATNITLTADQTQAATISLSRLVARISINSIKTAFDVNGAYKNATFTLQKVFLYNAMSTSTVIPTVEPAGTTPIHGGVAPGGIWATNTPWLVDAITGVANTEHTTPHWFYTFANDGTSTPTKFVIVGQLDIDGLGITPAETVYYPIVVNKAQTGTVISGSVGDSTIKRNSEYKLTAIIKGKGVSDPDQNIDPASLALTINVANWALTITQDVIFE
ncbi:fimbrial protein [Bacteroides sp.]|uniref:fimbrial protein n=1 Tax=Bacteroides sp. TaxID=29523 RepID=UPI002FCBAC65